MCQSSDLAVCFEVANLLSASDEIRLVKDKRYGSVNTSVEGNWDGIIGELVRRVSRQRLLMQ